MTFNHRTNPDNHDIVLDEMISDIDSDVDESDGGQNTFGEVPTTRRKFL